MPEVNIMAMQPLAPEPGPDRTTAMDAGLHLLAVLDAKRLQTWQALHLSVTHLRFLEVLAEREDAPRLSELAERTRIHPAQITAISQRLSTLGLIDVTVDRADRRARRVSLTQLGRLAFFGPETTWRTCAQALVAGLRADQTRLLLSNLKRFDALLTRERVPNGATSDRPAHRADVPPGTMLPLRLPA
jgi:DNA-binding MarR family transcriptional regulator